MDLQIHALVRDHSKAARDLRFINHDPNGRN